MDKEVLRDITNWFLIAGWIVNIICILGKYNHWFWLIAALGKGVGVFE